MVTRDVTLLGGGVQHEIPDGAVPSVSVRLVVVICIGWIVHDRGIFFYIYGGHGKILDCKP